MPGPGRQEKNCELACEEADIDFNRTWHCKTSYVGHQLVALSSGFGADLPRSWVLGIAMGISSSWVYRMVCFDHAVPNRLCLLQGLEQASSLTNASIQQAFHASHDHNLLAYGLIRSATPQGLKNEASAHVRGPKSPIEGHLDKDQKNKRFLYKWLKGRTLKKGLIF